MGHTSISAWLSKLPLPRRELNYPRKPTGPCVTLVCVQSQSQIAAISNRKSQCLLARTRNYNSQQDRTVAAISNRKCKSKLAKPCVLFYNKNLRIAIRSRNINLIRIAKSQIAESPEWRNTKCLTCRFSSCRITCTTTPKHPQTPKVVSSGANAERVGAHVRKERCAIRRRWAGIDVAHRLNGTIGRNSPER